MTCGFRYAFPLASLAIVYCLAHLYQEGTILTIQGIFAWKGQESTALTRDADNDTAAVTDDKPTEAQTMMMCGDWLPWGNPGNANFSNSYKEAMAPAMNIGSCGNGSQVGVEFHPNASQLFCHPDMASFGRQPPVLALDFQRLLPHQQPQFSVILPSFNVEPVLDTTLPTVCHTVTGKWELLLVLDSCYDGSLQVIHRILLSEPCHGVNSTLMRARVLCQPGSIFETSSDNLGLLFTNPSHFYLEIQSDMIFLEHGWNMDLARPFMEHNNLFSISGRCGHAVKRKGRYFVGRCRADVGEINEEMRNQYADSFVFTETNNRGPILWRADAMKQLGFLDEVHFYLGDDDHDINIRATYKGFIAGYKYVHFRAPLNLSPRRNAQPYPGFEEQRELGNQYREQRKTMAQTHPCRITHRNRLSSNKPRKGCQPTFQTLRPKNETVEKWQHEKSLPSLPPLPLDQTSVTYYQTC